MGKAPLWVRGAGLVAIVAALAVAAAGPLTRFGVLHFRVALMVLAIGAIVAGIAALVSLLGWLMVRRRPQNEGAGLALGGVLAGGVAFAFFAFLFAGARSVPPIHDITTDPDDPPQFVDVLPLRAGADNPPEYAGAEVASQQRAAYPEIRTLTLADAPDDVFLKAVGAVKALGWEVVATEPGEGRIEATDTTAWFGFKDDVVIRIRTAEGGGTEIDVRSKSRVGLSDLGANAKRISALLERVQG